MGMMPEIESTDETDRRWSREARAKYLTGKWDPSSVRPVTPAELERLHWESRQRQTLPQDPPSQTETSEPASKPDR